MKWLRLSLRARLAISLIAIAVLAVDLSMIFSTLGLNARLTAAAGERLSSKTSHMAALASVTYASAGSRWTAGNLRALQHAAAMDDLRLELRDLRGRPLLRAGRSTARGPVVADAPHASTLVRVNGAAVAQLTLIPLSGRLLTSAEIHLRHSIDALHLVAAGASVVVALAIAFVLASSLSAPLRRIRVAAERLSGGDLTARVQQGGDVEMQAVGSALNALANTLEREEELRKESLADLAHELRTPVTGLLSRIEAAQDGVMQDSSANLEAMHSEAVRLVTLLDDLRSLADAERPGLLIEKRPIDLADVVARQATLARRDAAGKRIDVQLELQPTVVNADPMRLAQVVTNLVSNAVRYTPSDGHVRITVRRTTADGVLEVADDGIGIPEEDIAHIFTRFWRGEKSRSRTTGGTGIGLTIVRELVHAHGGTVEVQSHAGSGSCFIVRFPLFREQRADGNAVDERTARVQATVA